MAKPSAAFVALGDPTRRAILELLRDGGQTAGAIADRFDISWPAVSRHLRLLKSSGLVWETREGRTRYYEINQQAILPVLAWLGQFRPASVPTSAPALTSSAGREYSS